MKTFKKVLASTLAAAMVVTAFPVTNAEAASTAKLSATKATVYVGGSKTLSVKTPSNWKNVKVKATSSKKSIAKISKVSGKKVTVKAVKKGTAKVTVKVTAKKAGKTVKKTLKATVTVKNPSLKTNVTKVVVNAGNTATIKATATPSSAKVTFASKDKKVATVSSKGVITGVTAGATKVVVTAKYGTKKITKTIDVVVNDKVANGITTMLANAYSEDYSDVVVTNPEINKDGVAKVKFIYGRNNQPVKNMWLNVRYSIDGKNSYHTTQVDTDNHGVAYWDAPADHVTTVDYEVTASDDATVVAKGSYRVGTIRVSNVKNINGDKKADGKTLKYEGYGDLVVGTNNKKGTTPGDGTYVTSGTVTRVNKGSRYDYETQYTTEYVASQQVTNKVGFVGGVPEILLPTSEEKLNAAEKFTQDVNITSGDYGVYEEKSNYITLKVDPQELTYATMNFSSLKLSKYTALFIETFKDEATAKKAKVPTVTSPGNATVIQGPYSRDTFSYQIPLDGNKTVIKVTLVSKGQVNTDTNKGYVIKDITGVYKKGTGSTGKIEKLKGAKITWATTNVKYSEEKTISKNDLKVLADDTITGTSIKDVASDKEISKLTSCVPVFPYTGNAIIRAYDKNGNVVAYFAAPTANDGNNTNVVTGGNFIYRISEEEATKSVGTVSQKEVEGETLVTVESTKVGTTVVAGTVSGIPGLDATNNTVYTSVQWNPVPNKSAENGGAIALAGQDVVLTAQLVDKEQNPVAVANNSIKFSFARNTGYDTYVSVLGKDTQNTNSKGQAELTVTATEAQSALTDIEVKAVNSPYDAVLLVNGEQVKKLDLYWVDAKPSFAPSVQTPTAVTTSPVTGVAEPMIGENWMYGFKASADTLANIGVWAGRDVTVNGVKIAVTAETGSKGTVKDAGNGTVYATSNKPGVTTLCAVIDGSAYDNTGITFDVKDKATGTKSVGQGATTFKNEQKLAVNWKTEGQKGAFVSEPGVNAVSNSSIVVYFKTSDKFGNALENQLTTFELTNAKAQVTTGNGVVTGGAAGATTGAAMTSKDGLVAVAIKQANGDKKSVVAFTYDGVVYKEVITWNDSANAPQLKVTTNATVNSSGAVSAEDPYTTYCDGKKIVLTFNDDVLASSVRTDMFQVDRVDADGKAVKQNIASVTASGKTITINFTNAITDNNAYTFDVTISDKTVGGVTYSLVSTKGASLDTTAHPSNKITGIYPSTF